jgi:8-oxo-dGTP pyrophosphatase MutT (NUDIX family)
MLVRDLPARGIAVYMTRRGATSPFMPDAYVFPGGAADAGDGAPEMLARLFYRSGEAIAPELAVTALRELFEEAGILLAAEPGGAACTPAAEALANWRAELLRGERSLPEILAAAEAYLDGRELVHYSNWITPAVEPRRFDAHFFIAREPQGQSAAADAIEVHDGVWIAPEDALERGRSGRWSLVYPTIKHLERLAEATTVDALLRAARSRVVRPVLPEALPGGVFRIPPEQEPW